MNIPGFLLFERVSLLLLLIPVLWLLFRSWNKNKETLVAFREHIPFRPAVFFFLFPALIITLIIFALMRPYSGYQDQKVPSSSQDILVLFDISRSMLARDVHPDRLEFAKRKLRDLIRLQKKQGVHRTGIILFAGSGYRYCPLTRDLGVVENFARHISISLIDDTGSSLLDAVQEGIQVFENVGSTSGTLLLISDGEDRSLENKQVTSLLNGTDITLSVLGVGSLEGGPIPVQQGRYLRDNEGEIVITKLEEDSLRTLSSENRGHYWRAGVSDRDLEAFLNTIQRELRTLQGEQQETVRTFHEIGSALLFVVLILLIIQALIRGKFFQNNSAKISILIFLLFYFQGSTVNADQSLYDGYQAYQQKKFQEAEKIFQNFINQNKADSRVYQSYGSSLFRQKRFPEAAGAYQKAIELAKTRMDRFKSFYNLGNTHFEQKDFQKSISAYEQSLKEKPGDKQAEFNLDLAKKMLEQQKQQQDQQQEKEKNQEQQQKQKPSSDQQEKPEKESGEDKQNKEESEQQESKNEESKESEQLESESNPEQEQKDQDPSPASAQQKEEMSKEELSKQKARAWLDSLSDAPLLLMKKGKEKKGAAQGEQQW